MDSAIDRVRTVFREKRSQILRNDRFAVLNVGAAKTAVHEGFGRPLVEEQAGALE